MVTVNLRPATPDDVPFLRRMQWAAVMASPGLVARRGVAVLEAIEDRFWAAWPTPEAIAVVAESAEGQPLGAVIIKVHERVAGRIIGYRLALAVESEARRHGIGRRLLAWAQQFAAKAGADYLLLYVDPTNEPAVGAYQVTGFAFGDPDGAVPMIVRFPRPASDDQ